MLNKIASFYAPTNTCLENIYVSVCKALERNYIDMYAYSWTFGYKPFLSAEHSGLFGKLISPSRDCQEYNSDQVDALYKYCGVLPVWHMNCEHENFLNIVKRELAHDRPVVLGTDIFYCHWHKASNKYHFVHFCIIVGMSNEGFICIDDTLDSTDGNLILPKPPKTVTLGFDTLNRFNCGFITFQIDSHSDERSSDEMIYLSALKTLTGFDGKSDYQNMRMLLDDFSKNLDINKEIGNTSDAWAIDLTKRIGYLVWSRHNYNLFLEQKKVYRGKNVKAFVDTIDLAMNLWSGIRYYIMKYSVDPTNKFRKDLICESLSEIIETEENVANQIVDMY